MKMTREYIVKEGILEAYFLGDLSPEQEQEVYEILKSDAELMKQYKDLEKSMEKLAFENAVTPPSQVKENLFNQISTSDKNISENPPVINLAYKRYFAIAASVAILFMTASMILFFQLNNAKTELKTTISKQERIVWTILVW